MKKIMLLSVGLFSFCSNAQTIEPLQADRPDQTETPALVPKGMFQVETGFTVEKNDDTKTYTVPSILWKYGVNDNFELRLITEFVSEKTEPETISGFVPVLIGCKIKISEEKGILPKTSFIGHIALPNLASTDFKLDYFAPEFRFAMQHSLTEKMSFSYNLGAEWDGFSPEPTFIYTSSLGYSITEKLGSYIELFGFAPQKQTAYHNFDGGITYLVNANFMVDVSAGVGLTEMAPDHYIAFGFSFRI